MQVKLGAQYKSRYNVLWSEAIMQVHIIHYKSRYKVHTFRYRSTVRSPSVVSITTDILISWWTIPSENYSHFNNGHQKD